MGARRATLCPMLPRAKPMSASQDVRSAAPGLGEGSQLVHSSPTGNQLCAEVTHKHTTFWPAPFTSLLSEAPDRFEIMLAVLKDKVRLRRSAWPARFRGGHRAHV